ncbi:unnamed protein product [Miscanthus lutarioriparius]|uniref:Dirigent protein n=1 Tax=Miscanthus lutarioriparius TaxID=422564 RepID=A0A811NX85_9POAL|nr:unnamed protein product [Miscanthus lutarioriparius]
MAPSSLPHLLFLLALTSPVAVLAAAAGGGEGDHGLTHIHLYVHETYTGANATAAAVLQSPLGANSSFGSMGVVDDEVRVGPDRSSQLVGRYQGVFFGTSVELGKGYLTSITLVFTAGEYGGSTLSVQGPPARVHRHHRARRGRRHRQVQARARVHAVQDDKQADAGDGRQRDQPVRAHAPCWQILARTLRL